MHRFVVSLTALVALLLPAVADAAPARVVAQEAGAVLRARLDSAGRLCMTVGRAGRRAPGEAGCQPSPTSPFSPSTPDSRDGTTVVALAVTSSVRWATVDGGPAIRTVAARGIPRVRFLLAPATGPAPIVRFRDAVGRLVGAWQREPELADDPQPDPDAPVLLRSGTTTVTLRHDVALAPRASQPDRVVGSTCLLVGDEEDGREEDCAPDGGPTGFAPELRPTCDAPGVLTSLADRRIVRADVLLGSGRTLTVDTLELPERYGTVRVLATTVPRGEAVRAVRARAADGRALGTATVGAPPTGLPCAGRFSSISVVVATGGPPVRPVGPPVTIARAGGRTVIAAPGQGETTCVGLRGTSLACDAVPVDAAASTLTRRRNVVTGVVSTDVAQVRLVLTGGRRLTAPAKRSRAYEGPEAAFARFVAVALRRPDRVARVVAIDGAGHRLDAPHYVGAYRQRESARRFGDGLIVRRRRSTLEGQATQESACVQPRRLLGAAEIDGICAGETDAVAFVAARCAPRRVAVFGTLPRGTRGVRLVLAGGRRLPARVRRVKGIGRVWTAVPPRTTAVEAVAYDGRPRPGRLELPRPTRVALAVPPVTQQCGYDVAL